MLQGASTFVDGVLAVRVVTGMVRAVMFFMALLVTMATNNRARGWIRSGRSSGVRSHGPMTIIIEASLVASRAASM